MQGPLTRGRDDGPVTPFDLDNPVIALCAEGMACDGTPAEAQRCFDRAWALRRDDYDAAIAAHYVARHQPTAAARLHWHALAVAHAERVPDGAAAVFLASLHLNLGDALLSVHRVDEARAAARTAAAHLDALPADGYRGFVAQGIARLEAKLDDPGVPPPAER